MKKQHSRPVLGKALCQGGVGECERPLMDLDSLILCMRGRKEMAQNWPFTLECPMLLFSLLDLSC